MILKIFLIVKSHKRCAIFQIFHGMTEKIDTLFFFGGTFESIICMMLKQRLEFMKTTGSKHPWH